MSDDYNALVDSSHDPITFRRFRVQPPTVFYVTLDDVLELNVWTPNATSTVQVSLRMQTPEGVIVPRFETHVVTATTGTTPATKRYVNCEGFLLSASIFSNAPRGQCFVMLRIRRGLGSQDVTAGDIIVQGYPGVSGGIAFPTSPNASPLDGRGLMRSVTVANPAAGAEFSQAVPAGVHWILRSVKAVLTSSAVAGNRVARLKIADGAANVLILSSANVNQAASLAFTFNWFNGAFPSAAGPTVEVGIPGDLRLLPTWTIGTLTTLIDVGDQYSAIVLGVEEFIAA